MKKRIQGVKGTITQKISIVQRSGPPAENLTYQWYRNGRPIKGATQDTYNTVDADYNKSGSLKNITCKVTGDVDLGLHPDVRNLSDLVNLNNSVDDVQLGAICVKGEE